MIYLDNCSTTRLRKEICTFLATAYQNDFGNPSSLHRLGMESEQKIKQARKVIADSLSVRSEEIFFTSGGTESNNLALRTVLKKHPREGKHILASPIEHASVAEPLKQLAANGFDVEFLPVDAKGLILLDALESAIRPDTILVSIMQVNNELGTLQPIETIGPLIKAKNDQTIFHVDGVQSYLKVPQSIHRSCIDLFSMSAHKLHGPKGVGALFIREKLPLYPLILGGGQENGGRSGTENLHGILAFAEAVLLMQKYKTEECARVSELRNRCVSIFREKLSEIQINTPLEASSPYILNLSVPGIRGEVLLHMLEMKDIFISTASACSSNAPKSHRILDAIGLNRKLAEGTIRLCFSYELSLEDTEIATNEMVDAIREIRKITKYK